MYRLILCSNTKTGARPGSRSPCSAASQACLNLSMYGQGGYHPVAMKTDALEHSLVLRGDLRQSET